MNPYLVTRVRGVLITGDPIEPSTKPRQVLRNVLLHEQIRVGDLLVMNVNGVKRGQEYIILQLTLPEYLLPQTALLQ